MTWYDLIAPFYDTNPPQLTIAEVDDEVKPGPTTGPPIEPPGELASTANRPGDYRRLGLP